jgi:hypothetical protein
MANVSIDVAAPCAASAEQAILGLVFWCGECRLGVQVCARLEWQK